MAGVLKLTTLECVEPVFGGAFTGMLVPVGFTGGSRDEDGGSKVGMCSLGVDDITGSMGLAVAELVADTGVGSENAGGISGVAVVCRMDGRSKLLVVAAGSEVPWLAWL